MDQRVSLITLGVADLDRSRRFYEALGWTAGGGSGDEVVFFQLHGAVLGLYRREALANDARLPAEGQGFGGVTLAYNARSKSEVDAVLAEAASVGARILKSGQEAFWGGYSGYFADPDGHAWEVAFNPHWQLDTEGRVRLPS